MLSFLSGRQVVCHLIDHLKRWLVWYVVFLRGQAVKCEINVWIEAKGGESRKEVAGCCDMGKHTVGGGGVMIILIVGPFE